MHKIKKNYTQALSFPNDDHLGSSCDAFSTSISLTGAKSGSRTTSRKREKNQCRLSWICCCSFFFFVFLPHFSLHWSDSLEHIIYQNARLDEYVNFHNWSEIQISNDKPKMGKKGGRISFAFHCTVFFFGFSSLFFVLFSFSSRPDMLVGPYYSYFPSLCFFFFPILLLQYVYMLSLAFTREYI